MCTLTIAQVTLTMIFNSRQQIISTSLFRNRDKIVTFRARILCLIDFQNNQTIILAAVKMKTANLNVLTATRMKLNSTQ